MSFLSDVEFKARLAAKIQVAPADLEPDIWDQIITDSNAAGYNEIVAALAGRGFTIEQINQWDRGREFQSHQGLYWALTEGSSANAIAVNENTQQQIDKLDRRRELLFVPVTIAGELITPGVDAPAGRISWGAMKNDTDKFTMDFVQ